MPYTPSGPWYDWPSTLSNMTAAKMTNIETQYAAIQADTGIVLPAGTTYAQIQAACNSAATFGTKVVAAGALTTSSTLAITSACDLSGLTITYTGSGTAVTVGGATVTRRTVFRLPNVINGTKPGTGWTAGTVGVQTINLSDCEIYLGNIQDHESGLICYGQSGEHAYNKYFVRGLNNNKINLTLSADSTGYVNGNNFYGGRYSHNSSEGTQVTGVYHIWLTNITTSRPNGNNWFGASLESPNVVQYALNADSGQYNSWLGCRWEDSSGNARVRWGALAIQNEIRGGYAADAITFTWVAGASRNLQTSADRFVMGGSTTPTMQLENTTSSGSPAFAVYNAGTIAGTYTPSTDWSAAIQGTGIRFKNKADANDRVLIDSGAVAGGRVQFGAGSSALDISLFRSAANALSMGAANTFKTGLNVTGSRPSASTVGQGSQFYDTTLNKPIWSDGTNWRDAAGTIV